MHTRKQLMCFDFDLFELFENACPIIEKKNAMISYISKHFSFQLCNVKQALKIDVRNDISSWNLPIEFQPEQIDYLLSINMIHISSNAAVDALFKVNINFLLLLDLNIVMRMYLTFFKEIVLSF